jgi:hypothetical protein
MENGKMGKLASDMPEAQNPRDTSARSEPKVCSQRAELGRGLNRLSCACDRATGATGSDISLDTAKDWQGASYAESMAMRWGHTVRQKDPRHHATPCPERLLFRNPTLNWSSELAKSARRASTRRGSTLMRLQRGLEVQRAEKAAGMKVFALG